MNTPLKTQTRIRTEQKLLLTTGYNGHEWWACRGEPDLGVPTATGRTEREAVNELLDQIEDEWGQVNR